MAVLVNLWLLLRLYSSQLSSAIGRVLALLSSNMSALSSMRFVATTSNLVARNLARFATTLLVHAAAIQVRTQPNLIKGKFNHLEDFLSCSKAGQTPLVGARYRAMLPPTSLSDLPPAMLAVIAASTDNFVNTDPGHVRARNAKSHDSWLSKFAQ